VTEETTPELVVVPDALAAYWVNHKPEWFRVFEESGQSWSVTVTAYHETLRLNWSTDDFTEPDEYIVVGIEDGKTPVWQVCKSLLAAKCIASFLLMTIKLSGCS
jgi:hypothetical protein